MREIGEAGHSTPESVSQSTRLDSASPSLSLPLNIELHHIAAMAVPPSPSHSPSCLLGFRPREQTTTRERGGERVCAHRRGAREESAIDRMGTKLGSQINKVGRE